MEPLLDHARPSRVRRIALAVAALALPLALVSCGSEAADDARDTATDAEPTSTSSAPPTPTPTAAPTVGTYPTYRPTDYSYTLAIACFCMGTGVPVKVTVAGGEVTTAVYTADDTGRGGAKAGEPADRLFRLTINDIIDRANDTEAAQVDVDWPAGQDFPNSVYVDGEEMVADDRDGLHGLGGRGQPLSLYSLSRLRPMIIFWMSLVPSPISMNADSR